MAKEILDMVSKAESECAQLVADAKVKAKQIEEDAKAEAENIIKTKKETASLEAQKLLGEVKAGCDAINSDAVKSAEKIGSDLSWTAEGNRKEVIKAAVEKLF